MPDSAPDFLATLRLLAERRVELIIVGGAGAALHGAPVTTFDLDIVPSHDAASRLENNRSAARAVMRV